MQNFIRNNKWLWAVKIVAALFQVPATGHVFYYIFKDAGRGMYVSLFSTFMAVLLIDAFFIAVLYFLESCELSGREKFPWSVVGAGLLVATLYIGFEDEGSLAFAPRLGFIGLVAADLVNYFTELVAGIYNYWFSRENIEQRIRNKQVIARRNAMKTAYEKALIELEPKLLEVQIQREMVTLNLLPEPEKQHVIPLTNKNGHTEVGDGIVLVTDNEYAWVDSEGNLHTHTQAGKPFTLQGAKIARSRYNN